jgi:hypothetical protein
MEMYAILFSIPMAALASAVYSWLVGRISSVNRGRPLTAIRAFSWLALVLIIAELIVLSVFGALETRASIGPIYVVIHSALFFLGVPSLANLLVLGKADAVERWKYSVIPCTVLAFALVMMQYYVAEQLYGFLN